MAIAAALSNNNNKRTLSSPSPPVLSATTLRKWIRPAAVISAVLVILTLFSRPAILEGNEQIKPAVTTSTKPPQQQHPSQLHNKPSATTRPAAVQSSTAIPTQSPTIITTTTATMTTRTQQQPTLPKISTSKPTQQQSSSSLDATSIPTQSPQVNDKHHEDEDYLELLDYFNKCTNPNVSLPGGDGDNSKVFDVWFQCQGPLYDNYTQQLFNWVSHNATKTTTTSTNTSTSSSTLFYNDKPPTWGKRKSPLPPNSRTLILGNGHARQIAQVLVCQQAQAATTTETPITALRRIDRYAYEVEFGAVNATIVLVVNTYALFATSSSSQTWYEVLQAQLGITSSSSLLSQQFTSIVLTLSDECIRDTTSAAKTNSFTTTMQQVAAEMQGAIDCMTVDPPTISDWLDALQRNNNDDNVSTTTTTPSLVWTSPLTTARRTQARKEFHRLRQAAAMASQSNYRNHHHNNTINNNDQRLLGFIHARQYTDFQPQVGDCMAASRSVVDDCAVPSKGSYGNPCQGDHGGWVDLVVWDVVEFLWLTYENNQNQETDKDDETTAARGNIQNGLWQASMMLTSSSATSSNNTNNAAIKPASKTLAWQDQPALLTTPTFCRSPRIEAPRDVFSDATDVHYQCTGPLYKALAADLNQFVTNTTRHGPYWGRRNFGIPSGKKVLFYGNSHTRQVAKATACQQMELDHLEVTVAINTTRVHQFIMSNDDASMVVVTNTFAPYSRDWVQLTQDEMGMTLNSFDALVLGAFNNCDGDNVFSREMIRISEAMPNVDCLHIPPPNLTEIALTFPGPIIYVTMFVPSANEQRHKLTKQEIKQLKKQHGREHVYFVDASRYIHELKHDCRGINRVEVGDCFVPVGGHNGGPTHECTGPLGGHADLIAWDVMELLHQELAV